MTNQNYSESLTAKLHDFRDRLLAIHSSQEINHGLRIVSKIGHIAETVLYNKGIPNVWLPPLDSSIQEYSAQDLIVLNPLSNERYSLIQSPQIMKEVAAIVFGSNWRKTTCFRAEPGDQTHAQLFQQIDIEMQDSDGLKARSLASEIFIAIYNDMTKSIITTIPQFDYCDVVKIYGVDAPNLYHNLLLDIHDNQPVLRSKSSLMSKVVMNENSFLRIIDNDNLNDNKFLLHGQLDDDEIVFGGLELAEMQHFRKELLAKNILKENSNPYYAYWLINMPFASYKDSVIAPLHHIMTMPYAAMNNKMFTFADFSMEDLCCLKCDSYDLVVCTPTEVIEVAGGDQRIPTATLQRDAINKMRYPIHKYAFLLEGLELNEARDYPYSLAGFAFGLERLAMIVANLNSIDQVQLYPANRPDGKMIHLYSKTSWEDSSNSD